MKWIIFIFLTISFNAFALDQDQCETVARFSKIVADSRDEDINKKHIYLVIEDKLDNKSLVFVFKKITDDIYRYQTTPNEVYNWCMKDFK